MESSATSQLSWYQQFISEDASSPVTETPAAVTSTAQKPFDFGPVFRGIIIVIGVVGILANGLVLSALAASKEIKKELFNVLFVNQMSFDLYSSIMLVITFSMKMFPTHFSGTLGYWLCVLFYGETILWIGLNGSMLNMAAIAVERYVKIVWLVWHKKRFRPWMVYCSQTDSCNAIRVCFETLSEIVTNTYHSGGLVELNSVHRLTLAISV